MPQTPPPGANIPQISPKINLRQIGITIKHAMKTNGETNETYTVLKPFDIEILLQLHLKGLTALEKMDIQLNIYTSQYKIYVN